MGHSLRVRDAKPAALAKWVAESTESFCCDKLEVTGEDGRVAQLAEQCPFKAWVDGSSPSALTIYSSDLQKKSLWTSVQFGPTSRQKLSCYE
jgi:hypothetical protein